MLYIFLLFLVMVSESFTLNIINPYITDLVVNHFNISRDQSAFYAGLISGIYNITVFISSIPIGYLSDRFGKNFFMLLGLFVLAICNLTFTLTTNIALAVVIRGLAGLFNTNDSLCKAVIADEISNSDKRQFIFGMIAFGFQLVKSLSVIIGAVSVNKTIFGYNNPYFLPEFIGSMIDTILFISLLIVIIYKTRRNQYDALEPQIEIESMEKDWVIQVSNSNSNSLSYSFKSTIILSFKNFEIRTLFIINFIQNLVSNGLLFLFTLLINESGFGLNTIQIGLLLGLYSFMCFPLQYLINRIRQDSILTRYTKFYIGTLLSILGCLLLGIIPYFLDIKYIIHSWISLILYLICSSIGYMSSVPIINTLIMDNTDKYLKQCQGTVQGISRSLIAVSKGIGPILFTSIFSSIGDYKIVFTLGLILLYIYSCTLMRKIQIRILDN